MSLSSEFPRLIKQLRLEKGLSQEELSGLAGLDRTYISLLERGKRSPSLITIEKLTSALGIGASELIKHLETL